MYTAELGERTGCGSRRWTKKELKELKETRKVKGYEGHHINSVKGHPEDAGDPSNIEFVENILVGIMVITGIHQVGRKSIEIKSTIVKFFIFNDEPLP